MTLNEEYNRISGVFSLMKRMNCINESQYSSLVGRTKSLLTEAMTIEKAIQTFGNIPEDVVKELIQIDPTYKGGDNVGKLFTWIANSYLVDNSILDDPEDAKNVLNVFKENQNRFTQQVNIKQFKTITDLKLFLYEQGMFDESDSNEVANRIDNAEVRKGTKTALNGSTWLIIIPENYVAARHWGANTSWCTAADNGGEMYNRYLNDYGGVYYILINKQNEYEKYQFHFESRQFMDRDDCQIGFKVRDLDGYEELDDFFSQAIGDDWADRIEEQDEGEDEYNWEVENTFSTYPTINICRNNNTDLYALMNNYGEQVYDQQFQSIEPIEEETNCARFKDEDGLYGLLYLKYNGNNGETVEKYAEGLVYLSDCDFLEGEDGDEFFYIGCTQEQNYKLITNNEQTMDEDYDRLIAKSSNNNVYLIGCLDGQVELLGSDFKPYKTLPGSDVLDTPNKLGVILKMDNPQDGHLLYNVETEDFVKVPLTGRIQMFGYWAVGYCNNHINAYDTYYQTFLFGEPISEGRGFRVSTAFSKDAPEFVFDCGQNGTIKYSTFRNEFYRTLDGNKWQMISKQDAYDAITQQ